jgi:Lysylphosphatidylglycerol synthase TM region
MVLNRHCIRHRGPALKEALATRRKDSLKASAPESPSSAHRGLSQGLERAFGGTAARRRNHNLLMLLGLEILAVYLCVGAMGAAAHFLVAAFIFAVVSLGGALTMLSGGVGAAELGIAGTFASIVTSPGALSGFNIRDPHRRSGPPLHTPLVGRTAYPLRKGTGW